MGTTTSGKGVNVTVLDATPATGFVGAPTLAAGEGAPARLKQIEDMVAWPATNMDAGSYVRLCRFPTTAKVKKVELWTDGYIDNNATPALTLGVGVVFSDSTIDGTPSNVRGLTPTDTGLGATVATPATTDMNDIFGNTPVLGGGSPAYGVAQKAHPVLEMITGVGSLTSTGGVSGYLQLDNYGIPTNSGAPNELVFTQTPLINILGFADSRGVAWAAAGFFDVYVRVIVAASTQAAANLFVRVTYTE
jgi:hypothetical protein